MMGKVQYRCEDSITGIFSAIYDVWKETDRENRGIVLKQDMNLELFTTYKEVEPSERKAQAVDKMIRKNLGMEVYLDFYHALMAADEEKANAVLQTLLEARKQKDGRRIMEHLSHPMVLKVFELKRSVFHEAHVLTGFVRFRELKNGVMYAEITPKHRVLTCMADHFTNRYAIQNFIIHDKTYQETMVHKACEGWMLLHNTPLRESFLQEVTKEQSYFEELWKGFFQSISIVERQELRRQYRHLPKNKLQNMVEFDKN